MRLREHYHQMPAAEMLRELASWPAWMSCDQMKERLVELLARRPLLCSWYYDTAIGPGAIDQRSKHWTLRYALELNGLIALDGEARLYCVCVRIPAPPSPEMLALLAEDPRFFARTIPTREERENELRRRASRKGQRAYYRQLVELIDERLAAEAARAAGTPYLPEF